MGGGLTLTPTPETEGESALLKADSSSSSFLRHKTLHDLRKSCELQQPPPIPHLAPSASSPSYITVGTQASWPGLQATGATEIG